MYLRQIIAFQIQTFRKGLQAHQHAAFTAINALTVRLDQPIARLIALHQQQQTQIGDKR
ncbi:hypothetical protein D3C86_2072550 [compost metagenome]